MLVVVDGRTMRVERPLVLLGLLVAAVGAAVWGRSELRARQATEAETLTQRGLDRLATCLVGDPESLLTEGPLPELALRLQPVIRGAQLTAMGLSPERRLANPEQRWPARCATYAHAVVVDAMHGRRLNPALSEALATSFEAPDSATSDWAPLFLTWVADVHASGRALHTAVGVAELPVAARAVTVDTLDLGARVLPSGVAVDQVRFAPFHDDTTAFVAGDVYCAIAAGEMHAACTPIAFDPTHTSPSGTADADARVYVLADEHGALSVHDLVNGASVATAAVAGTTYGVYAGANAIDVLGPSPVGPAIRLVHTPLGDAGIKSIDTPVLSRWAAGDPDFNMGLFWGTIVSKRSVLGTDGFRLRVRDVVNGEPGPEVDIGRVGDVSHAEVPGEEPHLQACRSSTSTTLRVRGWDAEYFSFKNAGEPWTQPVELAGRAGASGGKMWCRAGSASLVDVRGHIESGRYEPVVTVSQCRPGGCTTASLQTREVFAGATDILPRSPRDVQVTMTEDNRALLVWRAGAQGGLRMRIAPLAQLSKAQDVVLFDDRTIAGAAVSATTLVNFVVYPAKGGALLLAETLLGTFLYRVDVALAGPDRWTPVTLRGVTPRR